MSEPAADQTKSWGASWRLAAYILATTLTSCVALVINMGMVYVLFHSVLDYLPPAAVIYVGQLMLYVGPYVLLFLEWRLWDSLTDPFRRYD